jgi:hypothetical protein
MDRFYLCSDYHCLENCAAVIEAITESPAFKK